MDEEDYCAKEEPVLLIDMIMRYETVNRDRCKDCGNPWFFKMESVYQCTTCGAREIHASPWALEAERGTPMSMWRMREPEPWMKPGAMCKRYRLINPRRDWDGKIRKVETMPWQLGHGQWVVKVDGVPGGVAVEAIEEAQSGEVAV